MPTGYYICEGVRRAVAAMACGNVDIPARLEVPGQPDVLFRVLLSELYSPKAVVVRDYRYVTGVEYPTAVLKTEPPPIHVEPLGSPGQSRSVPLNQVKLV